MNIYIYKPTTKENKDILKTKVSKVHGDAFQRYIEAMSCSKEQKVQLLDDILHSKKR